MIEKGCIDVRLLDEKVELWDVSVLVIRSLQLTTAELYLLSETFPYHLSLTSLTGVLTMGRLVVDSKTIEGRPGAFAGVLMNSSEDLIARARRGEEESFKLIFDRYCRPVISFIYDMVGERCLAEELAQETFVRAYRKLGALRDDTKLSAWLFGIAKNVARESIRARCREDRRVGIEEPVVAGLSDFRLPPEGELLEKELNDVIHEALGALHEDKRLVFVLKVFHQKSYDEIAEITGHSIGKLKTDLHRARLEMRRRISPYLET